MEDAEDQQRRGDDAKAPRSRQKSGDDPQAQSSGPEGSHDPQAPRCRKEGSQDQPPTPGLQEDGRQARCAPSGRSLGEPLLDQSDVATRLPAQDLNRARQFYAEKLGLEPVEERPGGLLYRCGAGYFVVFQSAGASAGTHTQMAWEVADIAATVATLRSRGVVFEEYDLPGLKTSEGIASISGNYPSKGRGEMGAWFKDSEGNLLGIGQPVR